MDQKLNFETIMKYIFREDLLLNNIYSKFYKFIVNYKNNSIINYSIDTINKKYNSNLHKKDKKINEQLFIFMLYSQFFKYKNIDKKIINFNSTINMNIIEINDNINFIDYRNNFILNTLIYFSLIQKKILNVNKIIESEYEHLLKLNSISQIEEEIIKIVFKKKKILNLYSDQNIICALLNTNLNLLKKTTKKIVFSNEKEIIELKNQIKTDKIQQLIPNSISNCIDKISIFDNFDPIFSHIINIYFENFFKFFLDDNIIFHIYDQIKFIEIDKTERLSDKLRKLKNYYLENKYIYTKYE